MIGALLALPITGMVTSTTNWASFSETAFSFRVTPGLLLAGLIFAVVMGTLGGFSRQGGHPTSAGRSSVPVGGRADGRNEKLSDSSLRSE